MPINNNLQPKKFRFILDIRGVEEEVLVNTPKGWLEAKLEFNRSKQYNGIMRALTLPFEFVFNGAGILRAEFATYGIFANVKLYIDQLNPSTYQYERKFTGKLDFSKYIDKEDTVEITATEDTFAVKLDAFDKQQYAIPVDVPEAVEVELQPLTLVETADFLFTPNIDNRSDAFFEMRIVTNQQNAKLASVTDVGFYADSFPVWSTDTHWFYIARADTNVRYKGHFEGFIQTSGVVGTQQFRILLVKSDGTVINTLYDDSTSTAKGFSFDYDFTTSLLKGERLFFYFEHVGSDVSTYGFRLQNSTLSLEYNTLTEASKCKALPVMYIFEQLVNKMNGGTIYPAVSYLLKTTLKQLVVTCTESIRDLNFVGTIYQPGDTLQIGGKYLVLGGSIVYAGQTRTINTFFDYVLGAEEFTTINNGFVKQVGQNPSISLSFEDFFQSIYSIMGGQAGVGCEATRVVLEDLTYFYRSGVSTVDFGENIQAPEVLPAIDLLWNKIKVGYDDQQYDQFNGSKEVMSTQYYSTDITAVKKELNLISVIRADPYGIETARVVPTDTAASRSDNDNFFLWLKPDAEVGGYYKPLGMDALQSYTGVDSSYYNWFLSPKQNLLRGGAYLHSVLDKMEGYKIKLTDWKKNISMVTIDANGRRVAEGEDIPIGNLPTQIFKPYYMNVVPASPYNIADLLETNPYGEIRLTDLASQWKGFISNVSVDVAMNEEQTFKLLLTPDNDLLKRVR